MKNRVITVILTVVFAGVLIAISISSEKQTDSGDVKIAQTGKQDITLPAQNMNSDTKSQEKPPVPDGPHPVISFVETTHDFGTRLSGEDLETTFHFKNTGDQTLIIERVKGG